MTFAAPLWYYMEDLTTLIGHLTSNCWFIFTQYSTLLTSFYPREKWTLQITIKIRSWPSTIKSTCRSLEHHLSKMYLWKRNPRYCNRNLNTRIIKFGTNKPFDISYNGKIIQYPPNRNFKPSFEKKTLSKAFLFKNKWLVTDSYFFQQNIFIFYLGCYVLHLAKYQANNRIH